MKKYKIYAAGSFVETAKQLEIRRPFNGSIFASVGIADASLLEECIIAARNATEVMRKMPSFERSSILSMITDGMQDKRMLLAEVLCQETAKPLKLAIGEVDRAIQTVKIASEEARRIQGEYLSLDWTPAGTGKEGWVKYFPVGVVGAISPFNFPLNLSVHKLAPAIAAGNTIILKPASQTPATVLELAEIIDATPLPKGAVSILPMSRLTGSALATDPRIDLLTFTGSPDVGWSLKSQAGKKKVVLELGGNAGVLVSRSADQEVAVKKSVAGAFSYSGQVCIHVQRIFVDKSVFNSFCLRFIELTSELRTGDPMDTNTDISAMIDETNALRVEKWIHEAVEAGARLLYGGKRTGSYVEPTVITGTQSDMKVCGLEVFGPVVTIDPIDSISEGISRVNDSKYGLQAGVFTNDLREMNEAYTDLHVGGVVINDVPTFRVDHMPYGGIKDSGLGREGVKYAILEMMEPKLMVRNF